MWGGGVGGGFRYIRTYVRGRELFGCVYVEGEDETARFLADVEVIYLACGERGGRMFDWRWKGWRSAMRR